MTKRHSTRWLMRLGCLFGCLFALATLPVMAGDTPWLTGRVLDPDGTPVPWVSVIAEPESSNAGTLARMDREDGSFVFEKLPPGPVQLTVEADGYETLERRIEPGSADLPLVVTLPREDSKQCRTRTPEPEPAAPEPEPAAEPGTTVSGRVLGLTPEDARREIRVLLQGNPLIQKDRANVHQVLGPDGTFRMEDIPPGVWTVIADAGQRRAGARSVTLIPGQRDVAVELELPPQGESEVHQVDRGDPGTNVLRRPGATLRGRVLDPYGRPVAGATVKPRRTKLDRWDYFEVGPPGSTALTDADGRFTVGALPPDIYDLEVSADGLLSGRASRLRAAARTVLDGIEIRLQRGAVVFGRVTDLHGAPIPWASVGTLTSETRAGEDGSFRLGDVPFGRSTFFVKTYGVDHEDLQREIEVTTGASWADFVLSERPRKPPVPVQEPAATPPAVPAVAGEDGPAYRGGILVSELLREPATSATVSGSLRGLDPYERAAVRAQAIRPRRLPELRNAEVELEYYSLAGLGPGLWSIEANSSACTIRRTIEILPGVESLKLDLDLSATEEP